MTAAGLFGLATLAVHAQPATPNPLQPPRPVAFQSAFEGYQPYTDDKPVDWKSANDTTARIGGWRAYAKEASAPAVSDADVTAPPAAANPPVKP